MQELSAFAGPPLLLHQGPPRRPRRPHAPHRVRHGQHLGPDEERARGPGFEEDVQLLARLPEEELHPAQDATAPSGEAGDTSIREAHHCQGSASSGSLHHGFVTGYVP